MAEFSIRDASRLSHAYIVASPSREEGLALARRIAAAAVCREERDLPCGRCRACVKALSGIHPDVITVSRLTDAKGQPRREILVDQIRAVSADAVVLPNEAERKVYIIEDADSMNVPAQNAALKLLEEPPRGVHFLLCVRNAEKLLPTVRSRCAELSRGGEEERPGGESEALAAAFLERAAEGDALALCAWCQKNEGMDGRAFSDFLDSLEALLGDALCARRDARGLSPAELRALWALAGRCRGMLRVNVSVKQLFGLLAVDAIGGSGNRG